jgi:hypothetical protein
MGVGRIEPQAGESRSPNTPAGAAATIGTPSTAEGANNCHIGQALGCPVEISASRHEPRRGTNSAFGTQARDAERKRARLCVLTVGVVRGKMRYGSGGCGDGRQRCRGGHGILNRTLARTWEYGVSGTQVGVRRTGGKSTTDLGGLGWKGRKMDKKTTRNNQSSKSSVLHTGLTDFINMQCYQRSKNWNVGRIKRHDRAYRTTQSPSDYRVTGVTLW